MSLHRSAREDRITDDTRLCIIDQLWQWNTTLATSSVESRELDSYFYYYTTECKKAIEYDRGEYTTVRSHEDIVAIANMLLDGLTKQEIMSSLIQLDTQQRSEDVKARMAEGSMRLVVRLISMVDIGPIPHNRVQGLAPLPWHYERTSLHDLMASHFTESSSDHADIRFEEEFTAFNLLRFAGLHIQWTNNLTDHLRLIDNDRKVCIFHQVTFLKGLNSLVLPNGLAKETLQTLALLFPRYDSSTRKWLEAQNCTAKESIYLDMALLNCDRVMPVDRRAEKFKFWRDELITLKEKFDKPRPASIMQFWYDRRNKTQWYTFWIAVLILCLTIFFGLVQSIEGALQVYKAYHPTPI